MKAKPKILIASVASQSAEAYYKIPAKVNQQYARCHRYDYYIENRRLSARYPAWDKVLLAKRSLERGYDYVWIVDADLMVLNHRINLFLDIIEPNLDACVIASSDAANSGIFDKPNINTGSVIYKNTAWTSHFLERWWHSGQGYLRKQLWEQSVVNQLIQLDEDIADNIRILSECTLNSTYPHECNKPDQFCLHLMSIANESRQILFNHYQRKVIYNENAFCRVMSFLLGLS